MIRTWVYIFTLLFASTLAVAIFLPTFIAMKNQLLTKIVYPYPQLRLFLDFIIDNMLWIIIILIFILVLIYAHQQGTI